MKFIKGAIIGGLITTGVVMAYNEASFNTKKKLKKTGKNVLKKMGIA